MSYFQAIVIGLLQGVTELFPVSSLGHSVLLPAWLGWFTFHREGGWEDMLRPVSPTTTNTRPRLKERYLTEVRPALQSELGLGNVMQVPSVEKIVLNCGVGRATQQASLLDGAVADLTLITGQKPLVTRAKKSIAGFKLREGNAIGAKATLRGDRMWEFYDRLVSIAIPRIRDFRGLNPNSFDGRGNYTFGVTEQLIFPEIDYDKIDTVRGMDITIVTTGTTDDQGRALLRALGFPFRRDEQNQG